VSNEIVLREKPKRHDGTILAERPNQMWGIDATVGFTVAEGRAAIFAMVDHTTAECLGIHVAKRGTRFEALEPVRQAVREQFGGFAEGVACGVRLRHDHGSQFRSDDFRNEVAFLGIASSPAFVREPEGNGCMERFFPTLKEQQLWPRDFTTLENLARHSKNSASGTTTIGSWRGSVSNPRGRLVRGCLPLRLLHDGNQENCSGNRVRYILISDKDHSGTKRTGPRGLRSAPSDILQGAGRRPPRGRQWGEPAEFAETCFPAVKNPK